VKLEGWESRLDRYMQATARQPFAYGVLDCVIFASDWVIEAVNIDPMLEGRGQYDNLRDGAILIKQWRGGYEGIMDHYFDRIAPRYAQRGDIVLARGVDGTDAPAYGIVNNGAAWFKGQNEGLINLPMRRCALAWRL